MNLSLYYSSFQNQVSIDLVCKGCKYDFQPDYYVAPFKTFAPNRKWVNIQF